MKKNVFILLIFTLLIAGCSGDDASLSDPQEGYGSLSSDVNPGGVWLKVDGVMIIGTSDIDYYDASSHIFYLKSELPNLKEVEHGKSLSVFVDQTEIYSCSFHSLLSSSVPTGPYILSDIFLYPLYVVKINFSSFSYGDNIITDPRDDDRIIEALKKYEQYHEGMSFEIQSVKMSQGKMIVDAELYNPDTFDYYYLDPDKMGMGLFHYYTNGLLLYDNNYKSYTTQETPVSPEPWDSWNIKWMSLIKSGERKKISLTYNSFEEVPPGSYQAHFSYPGLSHHVKQNELQQTAGRIRLGDIPATKDIVID